MLLTSFRPASGPPSASSVFQSPDLAAAFTNRTTLVDAPGEVVPSNVTSASNGGTTIWQWSPQVNGWFDINTFGSSFDTRLSVYEGTAVDSLTWIAGNDDAYPGEFAVDHPQPDRSAVVIPLSSGKTYQIAISGGANGLSGGTLQWGIELVNEPLPPAVETRTHFPFAFLPAEYGGGTALIDTIVPVGSFGKEEPYVQILDTRSGAWNTVAEVDGQTVDTGNVTVRPFLGAGSTLRTSDAALLSSKQRFSTASSNRFFTNPTSPFPGPFVTVASARYPHRFGAGRKSICVDLRARGGQGYGLTHMPIDQLDSPSQIEPGKGGLQVDFQFVGNPPPDNAFGYTLKNAAGTPVDSRMGTSAEGLIANLEPGLYSISFEPVEGYRISVSREGVGVQDSSIANINLMIPNVIEEGCELINRSRNMCIFFPNSVDCTHFSAPNFAPPEFLAASGCDVVEGFVTNVTVQYIELNTGKDIVGYINVPDPNQVLDDEDVIGGATNPMVESTFLDLSNEAQTMVLAMRPDEDADAGRVLRWKKPEDAFWVKWRNFVSLGRNFPPADPLDPIAESLCFDCHTHNFDDPRGSLGKSGGGEPRVPWFKPVGGDRDTIPIEDRLEPLDEYPFTLAIMNRPFDNGLNFRMPIDIEANGAGMPPRLSWVDYAGQRWQILQEAGAGYVPTVTITGGNQVNLSPGTAQQTVSFSATDFWFLEAIDSPWIHIIGSEDGDSGTFNFILSFDPNPGATPRIGIVQIGDMFLNVVQPIEPPEITSLESLLNPRGYRFTINPVNGVTYDLEFSDSLAPGSWMMQQQAVGERDQSQLNFDALFPAIPSRGFYRIASKPVQ
jgi:hypothetical protein